MLEIEKQNAIVFLKRMNEKNNRLSNILKNKTAYNHFD